MAALSALGARNDTAAAQVVWETALGLTKLGIHHELLPPGRRTSFPHAESAAEEFVYVIEGMPDAWIDGELVRLAPGDGVGFPAGTGIAHSFLNNTDQTVRLLVVGEPNKPAGLAWVWERIKAGGWRGRGSIPSPHGVHRYACRYVIMVPDHVRGSVRTVIHVFEPPRQERRGWPGLIPGTSPGTVMTGDVAFSHADAPSRRA